MRKLKLLQSSLVLCFGILGLVPAGYGEGDLRLEGVIFDSSQPAESIALLNGQYLKRTERIEGFIIEEVGRDYVRLMNENDGTGLTLRITAAARAEPESPAEDLPVKAPSESFWEKIKRFWADWNPQALVQRAWEMKALLDIAKIYNGAVHYFNKHRQLASSIPELVDAKFLSDSFRNPVRGKYRFYLDPASMGLGIHADPVDAESGYHYLYVGQDAVIRSNLSGPATSQSEAHDY